MIEMTWVRFNVIARNAATGAQVAMWLRERLPAAMIRSEPGESPPDDPGQPHMLHCLACIAGFSATQTRQALEDALRGLDAARESRASVDFREEPSA
jgi:hypothetical protein